jgi:hypothetical protein
MCEPLYFSKCEEYLDKAENIYKSNNNLPKSLYQKFKLKKAAFLKKFGFFDKAIDYLKDLEEELKTQDTSNYDAKEKALATKLLFKVYRDLARL